MDIYFIIPMMLLITGMIIGISQVPPRLELFYGGLAGAVILIAISTMKNRKERKELRRQKRRSKK